MIVPAAEQVTQCDKRRSPWHHATFSGSTGSLKVLAYKEDQSGKKKRELKKAIAASSPTD